MVAALYKSRCSKGGTRTFVHGRGNFGWEVTEDMYKCETECKRTGQCVHVPKLKAIMCIGIHYNVSTTDQKLTDQDPVLSEIRKIVL